MMMSREFPTMITVVEQFVTMLVALARRNVRLEVPGLFHPQPRMALGSIRRKAAAGSTGASLP
jgi:hypothetical protein